VTDDQYKQFLNLLAHDYLRAEEFRRNADGKDIERLRSQVESIAWTARLNDLVKDGLSKDGPNNIDLVRVLEKQLRDAPIHDVHEAMYRIGMLDALDDSKGVVFANLRRSAIPEEDVELLRSAGAENPELVIGLAIDYGQRRIANADRRPSHIPSDAEKELGNAVKELSNSVDRLKDEVRQGKAPKKRKLFNGIGKILSGTVAGGGNVLLALGTLAAPNPATGYAAIGSGALAIGLMGQGIGDLRGE